MLATINGVIDLEKQLLDDERAKRKKERERFFNSSNPFLRLPFLSFFFNPFRRFNKYRDFILPPHDKGAAGI